MVQRKLFLTLTLCLSFSLMVAGCDGCRHTPSSTNPRVVFAATLLDAATTVDTVADGLTAANDVLENLKATEPDYYTHARPLLKKIAQANDTAIAAIRAAKAGDTSADWRTAIIDVSRQVSGSDLTAFGFKNPNSQSLVKVGFATLQAVLSAIPQNFGGK